MALFKCRRCGAEVSDDVVELQDQSLTQQVLPNYRVVGGLPGDAEDVLPEGFFIKAEGEDEHNSAWLLEDADHSFVLNIRDAKDTKLDYDYVAGCCGADGCDGENTDCKNGHKIGTERSDCWTEHALYLNPDKVVVEGCDEQVTEPIEYKEKDELLNILKQGSRQEKKRAAFLLAVRDEGEAVPSLMETIFGESTPDDLRLTLIKALRRLSDEDSEDAIQLIVEQLKSAEDEEVREIAAYSLKDLEEELVRDELLLALKNEESDEVREVVAEILGSYGSERIVGELGDVLESNESPEVRSSAASGLRRIKTNRSTEVLLENIDQDAVEVRRAVTSALEFRDDDKIFLPMVEMLDDQDEQVRKNAVSGICELCNPRHVGSDLSSDEVDQALPTLIKGLKDESAYVRANITTVMGRIGNKDTKKKLKRLKHEAENEDHRKAIERSIEELESPLESILSDVTETVTKAKTKGTEYLR